MTSSRALSRGRLVLEGAKSALRTLTADVVLKTDGAGWILDQFSAQLQRALAGRLRVRVSPIVVPGPARRIYHYVGGECFNDPRWMDRPPPSNNLIGVWWHGNTDSSEASIRQAAERLEAVSRRLTCIHVSCRISRDVVRQAGVADDRIAILPLGIDLRLFHPCNDVERRRKRAALQIPEDAMVISSFQKDGDGWGEGDNPKRIKGPDVLVEVLTRVAQRHRIFVLLTGPARGYVKRGLAAAGIQFRHDGLVPFRTLPSYYQASDVYLMTGREEGGPAAVLEAPACGVPFVGHRAGMAPDVLVDGATAMLADVDDVDTLTMKLDRVLAGAGLRNDLSHAALEAVRPYSWDCVAEQYLRLYAAVARGDRAWHAVAGESR